MRDIASSRPGTGACTLASAMQMWSWTLHHLQKATDAEGKKLYQGQRQGVTFPHDRCALLDARLALPDSRCNGIGRPRRRRSRHSRWAARNRAIPSATFAAYRPRMPPGEVSRICAELVFGYNQHPAWDEEGRKRCFSACELGEFEETMPGISAFAMDVLAEDGSHPHKAGPHARVAKGAENFWNFRTSSAAASVAHVWPRDRAAETVSSVMIPEALDYPA